MYFLKVLLACMGSMAAGELSEKSKQNLRNKWPVNIEDNIGYNTETRVNRIE